MQIKLTKNSDPIIEVTFTWNNNVTVCDHFALGVTDEEWDFIIANKGHEGAEVEGWTTEIDWDIEIPDAGNNPSGLSHEDLNTWLALPFATRLEMYKAEINDPHYNQWERDHSTKVCAVMGAMAINL